MDTTVYTTLQPCFMCTGAVIADAVNAASDETIRFMRGRGIEVVVMDPNTSAAARDCVALVARFRREQPELWLEDWAGGPNPRLVRAAG